MNYLAHAYLSFGKPEILAGNIFSDFIKGKHRFGFPEHIQTGIVLHRAIDEYTDMHEVTAVAKQFFKPVYGLYAAPFIDIAYDHFLATDKNIFAEDELKAFADTTYRVLQQFEAVFPPRFGEVFRYMQLHNWLYNYQFKEGIFRSFGGLVHRAKYMNDVKPACEILINNYDALKECYEAFFPQLKAFAWKKLNELEKG
ncbi:MAG: ACP phosphodiesterase [Chitinophagaceae bacterium]